MKAKDVILNVRHFSEHGTLQIVYKHAYKVAGVCCVYSVKLYSFWATKYSIEQDYTVLTQNMIVQ